MRYVIEISEAQRKALVLILSHVPIETVQEADHLLIHLEQLPRYEEQRPDCLHSLVP